MSATTVFLWILAIVFAIAISFTIVSGAIGLVTWIFKTMKGMR